MNHRGCPTQSCPARQSAGKHALRPVRSLTTCRAPSSRTALDPPPVPVLTPAPLDDVANRRPVATRDDLATHTCVGPGSPEPSSPPPVGRAIQLALSEPVEFGHVVAFEDEHEECERNVPALGHVSPRHRPVQVLIPRPGQTASATNITPVRCRKTCRGGRGNAHCTICVRDSRTFGRELCLGRGASPFSGQRSETNRSSRHDGHQDRSVEDAKRQV